MKLKFKWDLVPYNTAIDGYALRAPRYGGETVRFGSIRFACAEGRVVSFFKRNQESGE